MTHQEQKNAALQVELEKMQIKTARMRKLTTFDGFYNEFFQTLKTCKTREEAFDNINNEFYELFGIFKYKDYQSFKTIVRYHLKK